MYVRSIVTEPTTEPLALDEVKSHLNLLTDFTDDDELIEGLISAARVQVENVLNRSLITQTWDVFLDCFPEIIEIPKAPLISVTSVKYYDTDGVEQTLSSSVYTADTNSDPGRVYLAYNQSWPTIRNIRNAITVRAVTGYVDGSSVPTPIKHAMKLLIGDWYKDRETYIVGVSSVSELPNTVKMLISPYMVYEI